MSALPSIETRAAFRMGLLEEMWTKVSQPELDPRQVNEALGGVEKQVCAELRNASSRLGSKSFTQKPKSPLRPVRVICLLHTACGEKGGQKRRCCRTEAHDARPD